jgi:phage terminase large subunit
VELTIDTTITYGHIENNQTRFQHHLGGTRSGKTYAILQWLIVYALQNERKNISVVRKSMPSLRRSAIKDFRDIMETLRIWNDNQWHDTKKEYTFESGSIISFFSADDAQKLRGVKADITYVDEANELSEEEAFQLGIRTTQNIIYSYNPTISPYHYLRQQYGDDNTSVYRTTYKDNPYLPKEQIMAIEDLKDKNEKQWKVYGLGEFAGNERQIFQFNIIEDIPIESDFIGYGMDFGFSSDPSALVGCWKWGESIYFKELLYEKGLTTGDIMSRFKGLSLNREEIWCDSSEPRLIEELYRGGYNTKAVVKGKDSILFGINCMLNYKIHLHKGSQNLINEMYGYQWGADKEGNVTNRPEGGMDHTIDAARYVSMMRLSKKSENKGIYNITIR